MATLYFFGVRPDHNISKKSGNPALTETLNLYHSSGPMDQPFEIENKEEQPTTEDDESRESSSGTLSDNCLSSQFVQVSIGQLETISSSKSQTQYHTPAYVRLRSILI